MLADVETVSCQWLSLPRSHFNNGLFAYLTRIRRQCEVNKLSFKLLLPYKARALAIVHLLDVYATSGYSQGKCDNRKAPFYWRMKHPTDRGNPGIWFYDVKTCGRSLRWSRNTSLSLSLSLSLTIMRGLSGEILHSWLSISHTGETDEWFCHTTHTVRTSLPFSHTTQHGMYNWDGKRRDAETYDDVIK